MIYQSLKGLPQTTPAETGPNVIAAATDHEVAGEPAPTSDLDDIEALAGFTTARLDPKRAATA